ncbi:hypothetical protein N8481_02395, partial [Akkermansiaceae bacterium]|nr:hypothetical protein [Akkermansiaceae bacterium]
KHMIKYIIFRMVSFPLISRSKRPENSRVAGPKTHIYFHSSSTHRTNLTPKIRRADFQISDPDHVPFKFHDSRNRSSEKIQSQRYFL